MIKADSDVDVRTDQAVVTAIRVQATPRSLEGGRAVTAVVVDKVDTDTTIEASRSDRSTLINVNFAEDTSVASLAHTREAFKRVEASGTILAGVGSTRVIELFTVNAEIVANARAGVARSSVVTDGAVLARIGST